MKHYLLLPEDTLSLLPPQEGAGAAVSVFCERTLMIFLCEKIEKIYLLKNVAEDRFHAVDCLAILARDALFAQQQELWIPVTRPDFAAFFAALEKELPALFASMREETYFREACDETGTHLRAGKSPDA